MKRTVRSTASLIPAPRGNVKCSKIFGFAECVVHNRKVGSSILPSLPTSRAISMLTDMQQTKLNAGGGKMGQ
jgi:hypothetical protein